MTAQLSAIAQGEIRRWTALCRPCALGCPCAHRLGVVRVHARAGSVYCGTKHFVAGFTDCARHDLVGTAVRVSAISPGAVNTEFSTVRFKARARLRRTLQSMRRSSHSLRRAPQPCVTGQRTPWLSGLRCRYVNVDTCGLLYDMRTSCHGSLQLPLPRAYARSQAIAAFAAHSLCNLETSSLSSSATKSEPVQRAVRRCLTQAAVAHRRATRARRTPSTLASCRSTRMTLPTTSCMLPPGAAPLHRGACAAGWPCLCPCHRPCGGNDLHVRHVRP